MIGRKKRNMYPPEEPLIYITELDMLAKEPSYAICILTWTKLSNLQLLL